MIQAFATVGVISLAGWAIYFALRIRKWALTVTYDLRNAQSEIKWLNEQIPILKWPREVEKR